MNKFKKLQERIAKDYEKFCEALENERFNSGENATSFFMNRAYEIAHKNEITDVICDCCDPEYPPFEDDVCDNALKCEDNLLEVIYNSWMGYNHPERYNFFCYEDLIDVCKYTFENC